MRAPEKQAYLVISQLFLPTKGGTAVWAAEVYGRLGDRDTHIITARVSGSEAVDAVHPNTVHRLNLERISWLRPESAWMYAKLLIMGLWLGVRKRFAAVHAIRVLPEGFAAWVVARLTRRPLVIYAHGEELTGWGRGGKYRLLVFLLRRADVVIANSDFTRDVLLGMGVSEDSIRLIYPGVDTGRFRPGLPVTDLRAHLQLEEQSLLLLSVGRLQRRKGFDQVIRALPTLLGEGRDVHYAIVGIGEDGAYLRELSAELGVSKRVHLLGHVPTDELPRWYNACDVFIMPNRDIDGDTEGFGMVYIEAAACGKASVAGRTGGTGSAVLDEVTGLRVDGKQVSEIASALRRLLADPVLRDRLGQAGLARVKGELAWERVAQKTAALGESGWSERA